MFMYSSSCVDHIRAQEIVLGIPYGPNIRGSRRLAENNFYRRREIEDFPEDARILFIMRTNFETGECGYYPVLDSKINPFTGNRTYLFHPERSPTSTKR